jgi:hypothetical protein
LGWWEMQYLSVWIVSSEASGFSAYALCVTADL